MLDPKVIRDEPDKIRKMLKARVVDFDFDSLIELDKKSILSQLHFSKLY